MRAGCFNVAAELQPWIALGFQMPELPSISGNSEFVRPFPRSYWARPGKLLAGFYPGDKDPATADQKLRALIRCGVTTIINLMEETEGDHSGVPFTAYAPRFMELAKESGLHAACLRFPIRDVSVPTVPEMLKTLDAIDQALARNEVVYVHCWGGRGRTGTVVGCHLLRHRLVREGEVITVLSTLTAHEWRIFGAIPESECQREFVGRWKWDQ